MCGMNRISAGLRRLSVLFMFLVSRDIRCCVDAPQTARTTADCTTPLDGGVGQPAHKHSVPVYAESTAPYTDDRIPDAGGAARMYL